jgi:hypothetical protein
VLRAALAAAALLLSLPSRSSTNTHQPTSHCCPHLIRFLRPEVSVAVTQQQRRQQQQRRVRATPEDGGEGAFPKVGQSLYSMFCGTRRDVPKEQVGTENLAV